MAQYEMNLDLNVLNHLGINLYTKIPAVLSEAIANAYDADATIVMLNISDNCVTIADNGSGMDNNQVNNCFLTVGYEKRLSIIETPLFHRKPMGRKGIGKLSLFSIANNVEIQTFNGKTKDAFTIDVTELKKFISDKENSREHRSFLPTPIIPTIEQTGTIIKLTNLRKNRTLSNIEKVKTELARRFNVFCDDFKVYVNGELLTLADRRYFEHVQKIYIYGNCGFDFSQVCKKLEYGNETRNNQLNESYSVNGWIGFVNSPESLKTQDEEENANKIFIFCRGKMGQEDILSSIRNSSNYNQNIVGVINADFFDEDIDSSIDNTDRATTSRESFNQESDEYKILKDFLLKEIKYIGNDWNAIKENEGVKKAIEIEPTVDGWFKKLGKDEQRMAKKVLGNINKSITKDSDRRELTKYGILAFEKLRYAKNLSLIEDINVDSYKDIGSVLGGIDELEASLYYQIVKGRLDVLAKFKEIASKDENALEKVIQEYLFSHLWLLDPSWERPTSNNEKEKSFSTLFEQNVLLSEKEKKARLDICFKDFAGKLVIVELKRYNRVINNGELVNQVSKYAEAVEKCLGLRGENPNNYEIIVILGKYVDNNPTKKDAIAGTILPYKSRVVYYDELIGNAQNTYKSYFDKYDDLNDIIKLFKRLDSE